MKIITAIICIFLVNMHCAAFEKNVAAIQTGLVTQSLLLDIKNINNEFLVAVGERGHIIRSTDGIDWQQMSVPTKATLTSVFFASNKLGWAVGHDSTILHSQDGGITWSLQQSLPELERPLLSVLFSDALHGMAVGAYGSYYQTINGGKTWQQSYHLSLLSAEDMSYLMELKEEDTEGYLEERSSLLPHFNRVFEKEGVFYLAGELGLLASSINNGKTWQRLDEIYQGSFFDIAQVSQQRLLAVGLRGNIFTKSSEISAWRKIEVDTKALLNSIVLATEQKLFILGNSGVLLTSNNAGESFEMKQLADGKALLSGAVFNDTLIIASEVGIKRVKVID